jgi:hypothetical protein
MVETKRTGSTGDVAIRSDTGGRVAIPGGRESIPQAGETRPRIPTMRQLASLVINGILHLPAGYRRGMFLDVVV